MERLTIATLNIGAASKDRARRILDDWIAPSSFDLYVLTETSDGAGTRLLVAEFRAAGWTTFQRPTTGSDRGVMIASRVSATESKIYPSNDPAPGRVLVIDVQTVPSIRLFGMYAPNRGNDASKTSRKVAFLDCWLRYLLDDAPNHRNQILIGDLNVVPTSQRPQFLPQMQIEYDWYLALSRKAMLYDVALKHNASAHESTWVANTGEGYTYDHIMLHSALKDRVHRFSYDHSTRQQAGVTDHSGLTISLDLEAIHFIHRRGVTIPKQSQLFPT